MWPISYHPPTPVTMTSYPAQLTEDEAKKGNAKPEKLKKMYVLAALLIESYHESMKQQSKSKHKGKRDRKSVV